MLWACLATAVRNANPLQLPHLLAAELLQPALLDLDARGADPVAGLDALPLDADDAFTEFGGTGGDLHPDHRALWARLHVWSVVTVLQRVGLHGDQGLAALESVGGEVWLAAELESWDDPLAVPEDMEAQPRKPRKTGAEDEDEGQTQELTQSGAEALLSSLLGGDD